ncbi:MAG: arsenate reductase (glutaredoxin) [Ghiorsea sp.]
MGIEIYHNPRCSKSRAALNLLEEKGVEFKVIEYLKESPSADEINVLLKKLDFEPLDLMRKGEDEFKTHVVGQDLSRDELVALMVAHPKLIERPIVANDIKAAIARPLELILPIIA